MCMLSVRGGQYVCVRVYTFVYVRVLFCERGSGQCVRDRLVKGRVDN